MIIVIQCAATKRPSAGFLKTQDGKPVVFVAQPGLAPSNDFCLYARPDDLSDNGQSWREVLLRYNEAPGDNPLGLSPAYALYRNPVYERLVTKFGPANVFIVSAGWGLVNAGFLTPYYDITFNSGVEGFKHRLRQDRYHDFCMLPEKTTEDVIFLGGKDLTQFFLSLTSEFQGKRIIYYNSSQPPDAAGCTVIRFPTAAKTNWHYECAKALINEKIS